MLMNMFKNFWKDEEGQTSTEYILLVAAVAVIVMKFGSVAKSKLIGMTDTVFTESESSFKTNMAELDK